MQPPLPQGVHAFVVSPKGNHTPAYAAAPVQLPVLRRSAAAGAPRLAVVNVHLEGEHPAALTRVKQLQGALKELRRKHEEDAQKHARKEAQAAIREEMLQLVAARSQEAVAPLALGRHATSASCPR